MHVLVTYTLAQMKAIDALSKNKWGNIAFI